MMLSVFLRHLAVLFGVAVTTVAMAESRVHAPTSFPALGKRVYVVKGSAPVEIRDGKSSAPATGVVVFRDPVMPGGGTPARVSHHGGSTVGKPSGAAPTKVTTSSRPKELPVARPSILSFRPVVVAGKPMDPQVRFEREPIEMGRVDEPESIDFLPKVYETNQQGF